MSEFPPAVIRDLKKRSRGICEGCGGAKATQAHHRQYRSRGGPDTLSNALHLCGSGNHTGCHGIAHTAKGEALGWSIRSGFDPLEIPALLIVDFTEVWRTLDDAGDHADVNPIDAIEHLTLIGARKVVT